LEWSFDECHAFAHRGGCFFCARISFYFSFIAAKVAVINDTKVLPSSRLYDGQNYYPMNKWVLFGHHFAAIAGAGPLVGPVLAVQFGYFLVFYGCDWRSDGRCGT